jgi:hypothetical protein
MSYQNIKVTARKTYASIATMERAVEKLTAGDDEIFRFLTMTTEGGRYYPVFILGADQMHAIPYLANNGFCAVA